MSRFFAVGDIHGCSRTLAMLLEILDLGPGDTFLSTGDLSSKGEDSRGVHQQLIDLQHRGVNVIVLLGNHEVMLMAMQRRSGADMKTGHLPESIFVGGDISFLVRSNETWATLKSYDMEGADDPELWAFRHDDPRRHFDRVADRVAELNWQLPKPHADLLSQCKTHHIERNCLFIHSGVQPEFLGLSDVHAAVRGQLDAKACEVCWTREALGRTPGFPELMVHGHTPLFYLHSYIDDTAPWRDPDLVFKSAVYRGALNLDTGVFLEAGHLTAVEIPEDGCPADIRFFRVPRRDPVCKDRLWHMNHR